jgi:hypothetical protein
VAAIRIAIAAGRSQRIQHIEPAGPSRSSRPTTRLDQQCDPADRGSVVTLLADSGDRYADTYFCDEWIKSQELDTSAPAAALTEFERSGHWE